MIYFEQKGDFKKSNQFFERLKEVVKKSNLDFYGEKGVRALEAATPKDSGLAASSWYYVIEHGDNTSKISWCNNDIENGYNVAILVQYGHATKSGTFVQGVDYINPAMKHIFDEIAREIEKEVKSL